jgi:hypothetical protein
LLHYHRMTFSSPVFRAHFPALGYSCTAGLLTIVAAAAVPASVAAPKPALSPTAVNGRKIQFAERYGKLPLGFEANAGQTDSAVRFLSRGKGYTLFLTGSEAVLSLKNATAAAPTDSLLRMKLVGANGGAAVTGTDELPGKSNYFIGNDPAQWRTNVPNYARVEYRNVYPGVDLVYYGNRSGQLEYDFQVAPGASPAAIRFAIGVGPQTGRKSRIDPSGDLIVETGGGAVRFHKPVIYQLAMNHRQWTPIDGHYVLRAGNQIGFEIPSWDHTQPLVIDPVLTWSTFLGGSGSSEANGIAVDSVGNAYVTGYTSSTNFPTMNPSQTTNKAAPNATVFVAELNAAGTALVYSTYLGGSGGEQSQAIAVDSYGDAYVTGQTVSIDFPVMNPFQSACGGCGAGNTNAFVAELNPGGSALLYSTYLGGTGPVTGTGIAADSSGNTYVTGTTFSADFPTANALLSTFQGTEAAFVAKLHLQDATLSLAYSTYLGGNNSTQAFGIGTDSLGDAYVTGSTSATNFPTMNAIQPNCSLCGPGSANAFVTELNAAGSALVYSTYLGGTTAGSSGRGIAVDSSGSAYVTGFTNATDFPAVNPFQAACGKCTASNSNAFVAKFNPGGSALVYSTYLGGNWFDQGYAIAVDSSGDAYVTGMTESTNFPTLNAFQTTLPEYGEAAFVTELNAAGSALVYSTYLGGSGAVNCQGIAVDSSGNTYVTGGTSATDFPILNPVQATFAGESDAFVTKMAPGVPALTLSPTSLTFGTQDVNIASAPQTVTVTNTGNAPLVISDVALSGAALAGGFTQTTTCGTTVSAGGNCTIAVTFTPTATGLQSGVLAIVDNVTGSPQFVGLSGTGLPLTATASPASLSFGSQVIGTTSTPLTVTFSNTSSGTIAISSILASSQFAVSTTTCGNTVSAEASCTIGITFTPTATGPQTGTLTITDNAAGSPQSVPLTGTGIQSVATVSPASLSFGNQPVGVTSAPQTVTLTNTTSATVFISDIYTSKGDFAQWNHCGNSLRAGASCTIGVTFTPTATGARTGTLFINEGSVTINQGTAAAPQSVPLTGTGAAPVAGLSPNSLSFGPQAVGSVSAPQTVTLSNAGTMALAVWQIAASGDFAATNNCGSSVSAGTSCAIAVTFNPGAPGPRRGTLMVFDNAPDSPHHVSLTGTGIGPADSLSPPFLYFEPQTLGSTSAPQTVTLTNTGTVALAVSKIAASGDFAATGNCGSSLNTGANCTIAVTFTPTAVGPRIGTLTIADGAADSPRQIPLAGMGSSPAAVSPAFLLFGPQTVGKTSALRTVTLTNTGTAALAVSKIAASGDFTETNNCGSSLSAGASCTIAVTLTPASAGPRFGFLTITDSAPDSPQQIPLTSMGIGPQK